jgi:hypothetical protein
MNDRPAVAGYLGGTTTREVQMSGDPESYGDYSVDDETQLSASDTLDDPDVPDELDRGYSPPDYYSSSQHYGTTAWEEEHRETIAQRIRQEEPDTDPYAETDADEPEDGELDRESGGRRAGRLGAYGDSDVFGQDVGIDGAGASAEEAAVHILADEDE